MSHGAIAAVHGCDLTCMNSLKCLQVCLALVHSRLPSPKCSEMQVSNPATHACTCLISWTQNVWEACVCVVCAFSKAQCLYVCLCVCSLSLSVTATLKHKLTGTITLRDIRTYYVLFAAQCFMLFNVRCLLHEIQHLVEMLLFVAVFYYFVVGIH